MHGRLALRFEQQDGASVMRVDEQQPPWKVVRAFSTPAGESLVHLNNISGGVLGGDCLELCLEVGAGVAAQVTTTSATRVYRPRPDAVDAVCDTRIHVASGGLLEYLPDPLIPFRGARLEQRTRIVLEDGAALFWWETLAPGRAAAGELFEYDCLRVATDIRACEQPILADRIRIEPGKNAPESAARFGPYRYVTTFVASKIGERESTWRELETKLAETAEAFAADGVLWGTSVLAAHGVAVRGLSMSGQPIPSALEAFWKAAKLLLCGRPVTAPRKTL